MLEILRIIYTLQTTSKNKVATASKWILGDPFGIPLHGITGRLRRESRKDTTARVGTLFKKL